MPTAPRHGLPPYVAGLMPRPGPEHAVALVDMRVVLVLCLRVWRADACLLALVSGSNYDFDLVPGMDYCFAEMSGLVLGGESGH